MHYLDESMILIFLLQVSLLLGLSRAAGLLLQRFGQPCISGEILVGILLGPTIFGRLTPGLFAKIFPPDIMQQNMLETVAWMGILFFLLEAGLDTSLTAALRQKKDAFTISFADLLIPMAIAFVPVYFLPAGYIGANGSRILFTLFIATIMTISALPVTARILQDLRIYRSDAGLLTMCALTINDIAGWIVFAVILGFATDSQASLTKIPFILTATILFTLFCFTIGRKLTDRALDSINRSQLPKPGTSLTLIFIIGMLAGSLTIAIGIHALFGFFVAGIMAGESRHLSENTRQTIAQLVRALLVPLFFASIGLKIDFLKELDLPLTVFFLILGTAGRFIGAWVGTTLTRHPKANRHLISAAHTPGGEMQIVIGILALEYAVISPSVFVAIIVSAVLSSVLVGPWMKAALRRGRKSSPSGYLTPEMTIPQLAAKTSTEAISALCRHAGSGLDHKNLEAAVIQREEMMGTALGKNVAIPHARLHEIATPRIAFARVPEGVEWNAPDGLPAKFIFLLLTPIEENDSQIHMLRSIASAMSLPDNCNKLLTASDQDLYPLLREILQ